MEKMVSNWYNNSQPLPHDYIFPPDQRPQDDIKIPYCTTLPVIDISKVTTQSRKEIIQKIIFASKEFGFFQVITHGVDDKLIGDTMDVMKDFFDLPDEDKASLYFVDPRRPCKLCTSSINYVTEKIHYWRDNLRHPCHPLSDSIGYWPEKPANYRDVVGLYSTEVRKLALRILELFCEGLGLEEGYFHNELSQDQVLSISRYPPCPDPTLTLGLSKHCDVDLVTVLYQEDVYGLQVFKDGRWFGVEPLPNAFVINVGCQLQIISNGKLRSSEHRVITNTTTARTTLATFFSPTNESLIEPAKCLVNEGSPQLFKSFIYKDFFENYFANQGDTDEALRPYKLVPQPASE
ncbi:unnamed protein product [Rhodiola kirilowii]